LRLRAAILAQNPGKKVFLAGESMGGLIVFLLALEDPDLFSGLICISPAFKDTLKFSCLEKCKIFFSLLCNPKRQFRLAFTSEMCTRDAEYRKLLDSDKREYRFASARLLCNILILQLRARKAASRLKVPVLFLIAGKDALVDEVTSERIFQGLKVRDKEIITYPEMYHALPIELGREKVFADIVRWVQERI
jgi:alpha-beta hydrolase superfamily lysophospholipase